MGIAELDRTGNIALRVMRVQLPYDRSAYGWRFMAVQSVYGWLGKGTADGTANKASTAFLEASASAGWPNPRDWPHPGEQYDGELTALLDMFVNSSWGYHERELWVEKTEDGWQARIVERKSILWEAYAAKPGQAVLNVGRKALDEASRESVSIY